jgi:16S rRNA (cytidine1402-2'-O)-methyltransferase
MPGTLYVVATPIGNLEDLTFRAKRILGEVDLVAAEDTRRTGHLLAHIEVKKPMVSLREHNEAREGARLVARMLAGESVALVTDAGTPGIADPGAKLVRAAQEAGISTVPIPGASAVAAAMSVSGSEHPEFTFMGFPPAKGRERETWFSRLAKADHPVVFFEAPHRIERTLAECSEILVESQIVVGRELTKINEELVVKPKTTKLRSIKTIGEFVVVVLPSQSLESVDAKDEQVGREALDLFSRLAVAPGIPEDLAIELVGLKLGLSTTEAKKAVKKAKILVKQQK